LAIVPGVAMNIFLSHKYKAPKVNEFFFKLCSDVRKFEFSVDEGTIATNVTRLERLVRDADGFLGIYPFDDDGEGAPSLADLKEASKYFRLEMDLAARSKRPALVFADTRFRGVLRAPAPMMQVNFDAQEIAGADGDTPGTPGFRKKFTEFCDHVEAWRTLRLNESSNPADSDQAGFLLPRGDSAGTYAAADLGVIQDAIREARYEPVELPWPPVLNTDWIARQRGLNFAIVDVGTRTAATGIVGYLHGAFTPCMRLTAGTEAELPLYSGFEVGYPKDIVRWSDSKSLTEGLQNRLDTLDAPRKRITADDGLEYFRRAAKRKEAVFISYSGADAAIVSDITAAFARRFQQIFDYRDGKSIRPGEPWLSEIFDRLAVSPIGVPLLSPSYIASGNCAHELREMVARRDNKAMQIFPVKLRASDQFEIPNELKDIQYVRFTEYKNADALVEWVIANIRS
jgi:hypothetical protein